MRIAIIDGLNQDIGLKILFPEADYFIYNIGRSCEGGGNKISSLQKYSIDVKTNINSINDKNYDYLFIMFSLWATSKKAKHLFYRNFYDIWKKKEEIINKNNFKKVFVFDNHDYDYDPNEIINNDKIDLFFKRNYNKTKKYKKNVIPFPFIMFGRKSLIERLDETNNSNIKYNRLFFSGTLFTHIDKEINYVRDRKKIYNRISNIIYNPGRLDYFNFLKCIRESKYA